MTDLAERLRTIASQQAGTFSDANAAVLREAAAEVECLRAALREVKLALEIDVERTDVYRVIDTALAGKEET